MTRKQRHSIRLKGYDYWQSGSNFVTICTRNRQCLFSDIEDGMMVLSDTGEMVQCLWGYILRYYADVETDAFVIMPDHVHAIVVLSPFCGCGGNLSAVKGNRKKTGEKTLTSASNPVRGRFFHQISIVLFGSRLHNT